MIRLHAYDMLASHRIESNQYAGLRSFHHVFILFCSDLKWVEMIDYDKIRRNAVSKQDSTRIFHCDTWHQSMDYTHGFRFERKTSLFGMRE